MNKEAEAATSKDEGLSNTTEALSETVEQPLPKARRTRWGQSAPEANASVPNTLLAGPNDVAARAATARAAVEKAKKALALQKQVQQQIRAMQPTSSLVGIAARSGLNSIMASGMVAALRALPSAKPLRFDRLGREVDAEGKVIDVKPLARSTLKVNINKERETKLKQATFQTRVDRTLTNPLINPWYDSGLVSKSKLRRRGLSFVERGFYTKREHLLRTRELAQTMGFKMLTPAQREEQKRKAAVADVTLKRLFPSSMEDHSESLGEVAGLEETGATVMKDYEDPNKIELGGGKRKFPSTDNSKQQHEEIRGSDWMSYRADTLHLLQRKQIGIIPDVEWWDMPLLKKISSSERNEDIDFDFPYVIVESAINELIEHPVPIVSVVDIAKPVTPVLYLTEKERAKLRRRKRQEKEKEKRDKIRMGLLAPPPPRVKLANLARVLGSTAALMPSKIEQSVRDQVQQRQRDHQERNEARKLDVESKRKKTISKWTKMPSETEIPVGGAEVCVFSVSSLSDPSHLYKIDKNAQQFHVTGACIVCPHIGNLIIVEGSHKALKGFKKLVLRRIKWNASADVDRQPFQQEDTSAKTNLASDSSQYCFLLWQGVVKDRAFKQWKVYLCKSESEIKKILSDRNSEHYWEMLKKLHFAI